MKKSTLKNMFDDDTIKQVAKNAEIEEAAYKKHIKKDNSINTFKRDIVIEKKQK